jgi:hypothetical protein
VATALVAAAGLLGWQYVSGRPSPAERAAVAVVEEFYAGWNAHDPDAVMAVMAREATHDANGAVAVGGGVGAGGLEGGDLRGFLRRFLRTDDFFVELTGPAAVAVRESRTLVSVPNRLGYRLDGGGTRTIDGFSLFVLEPGEDGLQVVEHEWWEQGFLYPSPRWVPARGSTMTCPPGARPDLPGPVQQEGPVSRWGGGPVGVAMDVHAGLVVAADSSGTWGFDVCTNTWTRRGSSAPGGLPRLVYDASARLVIAFSSLDATVWTYSLTTQTWNQQPVTNPRPSGLWHETSPVFDPQAGLVLIRDLSSVVWTYDVRENAWAVVDRGEEQPGDYGQGLLAFDQMVDRLVLLSPGSDAGTWQLDLRTAEWVRGAAEPQPVGDGTWVPVNPPVFDEVTGCTVYLTPGGAVAAYDAALDRWDVLWEAGQSPGPSLQGASMVYDPVNQRVLLLGGHAGREVWAFDVGTATWTRLVSS